MTTRTKFLLSLLPATVIMLAIMSGCSPTAPNTNALNDTATADAAGPKLSTGTAATGTAVDGAAAKSMAQPAGSEAEHGHISGQHGGIMVSLGRDSYHIEAVVDAEGSLRLYTLGEDESRVIDVESQSLKGFVKTEGDTDSQSIALEPSPQPGDAENKTSLFVGKLPGELVGKKLDITIPNIKIAGERFRLGFQTGQASHSESTPMPDKLADTEEQKLYLTPGGRYTLADIEANGRVTASQKFKGIKSTHNMSPEPGERTCPISGTKANPKFTWVIDGKPYQFCCPPCVDEFVKMAKASNDPLHEPEFYIKK